MTPLEAYGDYAEGTLRLMVGYARALAASADAAEPPGQILDRRVDILRHTTLFDGRHPASVLDPPNTAWEALKERLIAVLERAADDAVEDACWRILEPLVTPILAERQAHSRQFSQGPYNCWRYEFVAANAGGDENVDRIAIHFSNAYCPHSPFDADHRGPLAADLGRMLADARRAHPTARRVVCGSWLNSLPPFAALFPPEWKASFASRDFSGGTAGFWGQYMDRRGAFHRRNGEQLRATGRHPYVAGVCGCDLGEAIRFVESR